MTLSKVDYMAYELTPEKIKENYDKFELLCSKLGERSDNMKKLLSHFEERLALCPASSRVEHHSCFPGGLVDHSLRVLQNAYTLMKSYNQAFPKESVILACLTHDLGKIGSEDEPYYTPNKSDWHRERGMLYETNDKLSYMTVPHRSLYLLQKFDIKLTQDEWVAICIHDGQYVPENKPYSMREPLLALIVQQADTYSTMWEKHNLK